MHSNSHSVVNNANRDIPKVDLVPTLSALFGIPIPFYNICRAVKGLLALSSKDRLYSLTLNQSFLIQLRQYLEKYVSDAPLVTKGLE